MLFSINYPRSGHVVNYPRSEVAFLFDSNPVKKSPSKLGLEFILFLIRFRCKKNKCTFANFLMNTWMIFNGKRPSKRFSCLILPLRLKGWIIEKEFRSQFYTWVVLTMAEGEVIVFSGFSFSSSQFIFRL